MPQIQFVRGKHYKGATYAPGDVAEVDAQWARIFVQQGAAIPADAIEAPEPTPPGVIESRDPSPAEEPAPRSRKAGRG